MKFTILKIIQLMGILCPQCRILNYCIWIVDSTEKSYYFLPLQSFWLGWVVGSWPLFWALFISFILGTAYSINVSWSYYNMHFPHPFSGSLKYNKECYIMLNMCELILHLCHQPLASKTFLRKCLEEPCWLFLLLYRLLLNSWWLCLLCGIIEHVVLKLWHKLLLYLILCS